MSQNEKLQQLQQDMQMQWWKAGPIDSFNLKNKLNRVGCRPIKRNYLNCKAQDNSQEQYADCKVNWLLLLIVLEN